MVLMFLPEAPRSKNACCEMFHVEHRGPDQKSLEIIQRGGRRNFARQMFHVEHHHRALDFAQLSSFCTKLRVAFGSESHYSALISGFSKN